MSAPSDNDEASDAPVPAKPVNGRLVFVDGSEAGLVVELEAPVLVIGRSTRADLTIDRRTISQRHATVSSTPEGHVVEDLGSTNGTFVDGVRVDRAVLRPGQRVRFGDVELVYENGSGVTTMRPLTPNRLVQRDVPHVFVPPPEPNGLDRLVQILTFLRTHAKILFTLPVLGLALGSASLSYAPPAHTASFLLMVDTQPQNNPLEFRTRESLIYFREPHVRFVRPDLVRATLEQLEGGKRKIGDAEINGARGRLKFARVATGGSLFSGSFDHVDPDYAVAFLRAHLQQYLESEVSEGIEVVSNELTTLEEQLENTRELLVDTDVAILELKQKHSGELPEIAEGLFDQVTTLTMDQRTAASAVTAAEADLTVARRRLADQSRRLAVKLDRAEPYESELAMVEKALVVARASGKGIAHPDVVALRMQVEQLTQLRDGAMHESVHVDRVASIRDEAAREALAAAKANLDVATKEYARVTTALTEARQHLERMPEVERRYSQLTRSNEGLKARYEDMLEKLGHVQTQLALETAAARARLDVVQPPAVVPGAQDRALFLRGGLAALVGLALALAIATIIEVRRMLAARQQALATT